MICLVCLMMRFLDFLGKITNLYKICNMATLFSFPLLHPLDWQLSPWPLLTKNLGRSLKVSPSNRPEGANSKYLKTKKWGKIYPTPLKCNMARLKMVVMEDDPAGKIWVYWSLFRGEVAVKFWEGRHL